MPNNGMSPLPPMPSAPGYVPPGGVPPMSLFGGGFSLRSATQPGFTSQQAKDLLAQTDPYFAPITLGQEQLYGRINDLQQAQDQTANAATDPLLLREAEIQGELARISHLRKNLPAPQPVPFTPYVPSDTGPTRRNVPLPTRATPQTEPVSQGLSLLAGLFDPQHAAGYGTSALNAALDQSQRETQARRQDFADAIQQAAQEYEDALRSHNEKRVIEQQNRLEALGVAAQNRALQGQYGTQQAELGATEAGLQSTLPSVTAAGNALLKEKQAALRQQGAEALLKAQQAPTENDLRVALANAALGPEHANLVQRVNEMVQRSTNDTGNRTIDLAKIGMQSAQFNAEMGLRRSELALKTREVNASLQNAKLANDPSYQTLLAEYKNAADEYNTALTARMAIFRNGDYNDAAGRPTRDALGAQNAENDAGARYRSAYSALMAYAATKGVKMGTGTPTASASPAATKPQGRIFDFATGKWVNK